MKFTAQPAKDGSGAVTFVLTPDNLTEAEVLGAAVALVDQGTLAPSSILAAIQGMATQLGLD